MCQLSTGACKSNGLLRFFFRDTHLLPLLDFLKFSQEVCPLRFSFTKADRILKRHEFIALSKNGRRIQNEYFIAVFCPGRHGCSRLGITVTKKVGGAVKRNKIKRLIREFFRLNRQFLSGVWDINIIAKNRTADITSEKAYRSLQNIINRISRYDDPL